MSISVHHTGVNYKAFKTSLQKHIERTADDVTQVKNATHSLINASETQYNKQLFKSSELQGKSIKQFLKNEIDEMNAERKKRGLKKQYSSANVVICGTMQISDDSLEKLGFDKGKLWSEQTEQARRNVTNAYNRMVSNALEKRDNYGRLMTASLHVDESTPHVDYISIGIDKNDLDFTCRSVLNGSKGSKKGQKLKQTQDDLNTIFSDDEKRLFSLNRGIAESERFDIMRHQNAIAKELVSKESELESRENELNARETSLEKREHSNYQTENKLNRKAEKLEAREKLIEARESDLDTKTYNLSHMIEKLDSERLRASKMHDVLQSDIKDFYEAYSKDDSKVIYIAKRIKQSNEKTVYDNFVDRYKERESKLKEFSSDELLKRAETMVSELRSSNSNDNQYSK